MFVLKVVQFVVVESACFDSLQSSDLMLGLRLEDDVRSGMFPPNCWVDFQVH